VTHARIGADGARGGPVRARRAGTHPHYGDRDLERQQDHAQETDPTLLPAGEPGRDGSLLGVADAAAVLDRAPDPGLRGVAEAAFERKPALGVASLLNPVVHRLWHRGQVAEAARQVTSADGSRSR
jgi:hypothetical protein